MSRTLHIVRSAFRATLEEQDDPILWLVQAVQAVGGDGAVLLCETAVGYGVVAQDASGLTFGAREQTQPPRIAEDIARMLGNEIPVYYVAEDAADRGISRDDLVLGLDPIDREKVGELLSRHDRVLAW